MRTSLNEIKDIEQYLISEQDLFDKNKFVQQLNKDQQLRLNVFLQQKIYRLLAFYRRRRVKERAEEMHKHFFNSEEHSAFRDKILRYF